MTLNTLGASYSRSHSTCPFVTGLFHLALMSGFIQCCSICENFHHQLNGHEFEQTLETVKDREAWSAAVHVVTELDKTK